MPRYIYKVMRLSFTVYRRLATKRLYDSVCILITVKRKTAHELMKRWRET
nr:MAG TPA: hypothetical protein [Caudoviricetes sp.]